jgi:hypothetical protein
VTRGFALALALLAGLAGPAAADPSSQRDAHRHAGYLFRIRVEPEMNTQFVYRAFLASPDDPASLLVERSDGYLGDEGQVDLTPAACPALRPAVMALAALPPPAAYLGPGPRYDINAPWGVHYYFAGFVRFANGGEGEISFMSYEVRGRPRDPQLEWMRGLVRAFDACRRRGG